MSNENATADNGVDGLRLRTYQVGIILLLSLIMSLVTICGNILVLFSFYIEPTLRISTNYFIASLAVTDLLIGLISMNLYTAYIVLGYWPLGELLCDLWLSMDYTACLTSQYTVFLITVDRYCSVTMPMKYRVWRSGRIICVLISFTWIIPSVIFYSIIMSWPFTVGRKRRNDECYAEFSIRPVFITMLTVCYFWSTLIVMIVLYVGIYKVALDLQRKADARKAKVNRYILNTPSNKEDNSKFLKNPKDPNSSSSKEYNIRQYNEENFPHSYSSCFVLESNKLPNVISPLIEEEMSFNSDLSPRRNDSFTEHHHCSSNAHFYGSRNCYTYSGIEFIDIENFKAYFKFCTTSSKGDKQDLKPRLTFSPIWKENKHLSNIPLSPKNNFDKRPNDKKSSVLLKSPVIKFGSRVHGMVQRSKERQLTVTRNRNKAKKALKTISLILGAFIMCWTPFHIVILIKAASDDHTNGRSYINIHVYRLAYWLCYINSPLNPFCYALSNVRIKETFFRILTFKIKSR